MHEKDSTIPPVSGRINAEVNAIIFKANAASNGLIGHTPPEVAEQIINSNKEGCDTTTQAGRNELYYLLSLKFSQHPTLVMPSLEEQLRKHLCVVVELSKS